MDTTALNATSPTAAGYSPAAAAGSSADDAKRAAITKTAQQFEASFLSTMFGQMFDGVQPDAPFGGGAGETAFRSFMMDAMGKAVVQRGGIGLSKSIAHEMLKMQGLS